MTISEGGIHYCYVSRNKNTQKKVFKKKRKIKLISEFKIEYKTLNEKGASQNFLKVTI